MPSSPEAQRRRLLERVTERVSARVSHDASEAAGALVSLYIAGLASDELDRAEPDDLGGAIVSLLELARVRRAGHVEVRIFNPSESDGWAADHTVIEIVNDDMPFLVDSVIDELARRELGVHQVIHPQVAVQRDAEGVLVALDGPTESTSPWMRESFIHLEVDRQSGAAMLEIQTRLGQILDDVRAAVDDWEPMRQTVRELVQQLVAMPPSAVAAEDFEEGLRFLEWINDNHFTFLGYCRFDHRRTDDGENKLLMRPDTGGALGVLRADTDIAPPPSERPVSAAARAFFEGPGLLTISKSRHRSTVHRSVYMDLISIKRFGDEDVVVGEHRFVGLFTSMAYSIAAAEIPLVRRKVQKVMTRAGFLPASHDAKALRAILEHYARDELLQISEDDLYRFARRILRLQLDPRLALLVRFDEAGRLVSCMVYVPRDQHNTEQRLRMQGILEEAFGGKATAFNIRVSDGPLAQLHFILRPDGPLHQAHDIPAIELALAEVARSWSDRLKTAMVKRWSEEAGLAEWRRYQHAFPITYQAHGTVADAVDDAPIVDDVLRTGRLGVRLDCAEGSGHRDFRLRTFERGERSPLSAYLPLFESLGVDVVTELPFEIRPEEAVQAVHAREFALTAPCDVDRDALRTGFRDAFLRLWANEIEADPYNRLVLVSGLAWRDVVMLRAYGRYLKQVGISYSQGYLAQTLEENAETATALVELFNAQFDPARQDQKAAVRIEEAEKAVRDALDRVARLDEDRILRRFLGLVRHTLRTNHFQRTSAGNPKPYISLKLDAASLPELPAPRPRYEIFVYSPRFEAVHLRGGKVARGGIRWSDRAEDYRTEILGLVKAQMVKNAVIVPVGAKGGFVLKRPPVERRALQAEARACYRTMMHGLLDLTDNYDADQVVPPTDVVRRDDDDPYLVVAADKGTATFSDLANKVAKAYGFWLGDAFASGGSAGYDHKKMGITARGAWESVKEHFLHLDVDVDRDTFTAVGVGDMSGDVFGNGMLLADPLKLVGAFNHRHVFVDPDPDPAVALSERRRLAALPPGSSWDAYDLEKLSDGGGVFDRNAKEIVVSDAVRERFGLQDTATTPGQLIRALLVAQVDLLWFGGIGTFVKAASESDADAGDRANDELRVDAETLRCRVIGEGANLGITQAGRVAYARVGGRCNTDFIDNSGGVDTSDHEVNIKIAFAEAMAAGSLTLEERDELLASMTDEVASLVLRDNFLQARAITLASDRRHQQADDHVRLMHSLENNGLLDRGLEGLPDDGTLLDRGEVGLSRSELAVLLAYSKIAIYNALLEDDLPDDPALTEDLVRYFPGPMQARFRGTLEGHRLRREIIATMVTNGMVNRVGPTFVDRLVRVSGRSIADVARAYLMARDVFELRDLWHQLERAEGALDGATQVELHRHTVTMLERATRWFLRTGGAVEEIGVFGAAAATVGGRLEELLPSSGRAVLRRGIKRLEKKGVRKDLSRRIAGLPWLPAACDIVLASRAAEVDVERSARVYFKVGERFFFDRLRRAAGRQRRSDPWQKAALSAAVEDLYIYQASLARQVLVASDARPRRAMDAWAAPRMADVARVDRVLEELEQVRKIEPAMLTVAAYELRRLAENTGTGEGGE